MADRLQVKIATVAIVLVLGLQFFAVTFRTGKWSWPFIDYPMYASSHKEGERIPARHIIYGISQDGREFELTKEAIGVNLWLFEKWARGLTAQQAAVATPAAATPAVAPKPQRSSWPLKRWLKSTTLFEWLKGKKDPDLTPIFMDLFASKNGVKIVKLRVEDSPVVVTRDGVGEAPPRVVSVDLALNAAK